MKTGFETVSRSGIPWTVSVSPMVARWQLVLAIFLLGSVGCRAPTVIPSATPAAPGASVRALVLGRIQVYLGGRPVQVGREGYGTAARSADWAGSSSWDEPAPGLSGEEATTMVMFDKLGRDETFAFEVEDESGRFEVLLPAGGYGIRLRCGKWLAKTPARFDAPAEGGRYYVGTLRVDLFSRRSVLGWFVRFFGGTVPRGDIGFGVVDEWDWAQANLRSLAEGQVRIEKHLMRLDRTL